MLENPTERLASHHSAAVSTSLDSTIRFWDLTRYAKTDDKTIEAGPVEAWNAVYSPDGRHVATGSHNGNVNIWTIEDKKKERSLETRGVFIMSVAYSPNGMYIACGSESGAVHVFDVPTGRLLHSLPGE